MKNTGKMLKKLRKKERNDYSNINVLVLPSNIGVNELSFINDHIHSNFNTDLLIHVVLNDNMDKKGNEINFSLPFIFFLF